MDLINHDIKQIKEAMLAHNKDDDSHFTAIREKLNTIHELHIFNGENIKQAIKLGEKTNGRVTNLEATCVRLDKSIALLEQSNENLCKIVSKQDNQYEAWVNQMEQLREKDGSKFVTRDMFDPVKKVVYGLVGLVLTSVGGALLTIIIK